MADKSKQVPSSPPPVGGTARAAQPPIAPFVSKGEGSVSRATAETAPAAAANTELPAPGTSWRHPDGDHLN